MNVHDTTCKIEDIVGGVSETQFVQIEDLLNSQPEERSHSVLVGFRNYLLYQLHNKKRDVSDIIDELDKISSLPCVENNTTNSAIDFDNIGQFILAANKVGIKASVARKMYNAALAQQH